MKKMQIHKINLYSILFLILFILVLIYFRISPCNVSKHIWSNSYNYNDIEIQKCVKCGEEKNIFKK